MPAYLVVAVAYRETAWTEAYRREVPGMIAAHGGRYLAKSLAPERLEGEGDAPDTLAILEFPDEQAARAMLASDAYQPFADARRAGAATTMYLL